MQKLAFLAVLVLAPAAALADAPRTVVNDSDQSSTIDCGDGGEVVVNGGDNHLTITGGCAKVVVNGGDNHLTVEGVDKIALNGADNNVTYKHGWKKKAPRIANLGSGNKVTRVK